MQTNSTTIIVNRPGLAYAIITVTADSEVAFAEHQTGSYSYYALRVNGQRGDANAYYDLVRVAHAESNPAVIDAFNAVLAEVQAAIVSLQPAPVAQPEPRTITVDLDTLIATHEAQPDTTHQRKAWLWLAEQSAFTFIGAALIVDSATWSNTRYHATADSCSCPARKDCWHKNAAATVAATLTTDAAFDAMLDEQAERDLPFDLAGDLVSFAPSKRERSAQALADVLELWA